MNDGIPSAAAGARQFIVGLTGGIGSGKSAAADCFSALGIPIIDTDVISRELTAAGGAAISAVSAHFGAAILTADGALDRVVMRQRVFADPDARLALEAILHPMIREHSRQQLLSAARTHCGAPYAILVVPLLVESGTYRKRVDRVVVVDCPIETQIDRVIARNAISRAEVLRILATQASREQRRAAADDIIANDGTLAQLRQQVVALDASYRANRGRFSTKD